MINYEPVNSPFYTENKNYCEEMENKFKTLNLECDGFCNAYGYEMEATIKKDNLSYMFKFSKNQTTQNGVIIPVNAHVYAGIEVVVEGLNKKYSVSNNKSLLHKIFSKSEFKTKISESDFLDFNYTPERNFSESLVEIVQHYTISKLNLSNGKLVLEMHSPETDLINLISDVEKMVKGWV